MSEMTTILNNSVCNFFIHRNNEIVSSWNSDTEIFLWFKNIKGSYLHHFILFVLHPIDILPFSLCSHTSKFSEQQKGFFRLILSIFFSHIFILTSKKRFFLSFGLWKESMQIIPLNSFIIYADSFFYSLYIFFIVYVNVWVKW